MSLSENELQIIELFRGGVETLAATRLGLRDLQRQDRDDRWLLVSRWPADRRWWYELTVRPTIPQVSVGLVTDDSERSRDLERTIADSGLTVQEFVASSFRAAGLDWPHPPVEHYREAGERHCLVTPLDLGSIEDLAGEAVRDRSLAMLDGYQRCFSGRLGE